MARLSLARWAQGTVCLALLATALLGVAQAHAFAGAQGGDDEQVLLDEPPDELSALDERVRAAPDDLDARRERGLWHEAHGDDTTAIDDLTLVLAADPKDFDALLARGRALSREGRPLRARMDLEDALELRPDDLDALGSRGVCNVALGRPEKALVDLQRAFEGGADSTSYGWFGYWLGVALCETEQFEGARTTLLTVLKAMPGDDAVLLQLGQAEVALELFETALVHLDAVTYPAVGDVASDIELLRLRARALRGLGEHGAARGAESVADQLERELLSEDVLGIGGGAPAEPTAGELMQGLVQALLVLAAVLAPLTLIALARTRATEREIELELRGGTHPRYDGPAPELFRIYLQNVALTVLTLGVYRFWAKVRATRFHHQHLSFAGARLDYHATGREKLNGFLKGLVLIVPLGAALYFEHAALLTAYGPLVAQYATTVTFVVAMFALRPLILVGGQRFNLARTSWSNVRLRFDGRVGAAYGLYARDALFIVLTFGLYTPFHLVNVRRFRMQHTAIGDLRFDFRGDGMGLLWLSMFGVPLCYVTLGLAVPWYIAARHRFWVTNTRLDGRRFHSRITGGMVFTVGAPAMLAVIVTLGLALPWAITRWRRLVTHTTHFAGEIDPSRVFAVAGTRSSATAEGVGEAGELLGGLGDLFGT